MKNNRSKILGIIFIIFSIIILLTMNNFITPISTTEGEFDYGEFYIKILINALRYFLIAIIFSKMLLKKDN